MELTSSQAVKVEMARERLAESKAASGGQDSIRLWGALEHHVESLLAIIGELTGAGK